MYYTCTYLNYYYLDQSKYIITFKQYNANIQTLLKWYLVFWSNILI